MAGVSVELLYWEDCPSHPAALADLRAALRELGHGGLEVALRHVGDDAEAAALGFVGSPTIRVGGTDVVPPPPGEPPALACRVYRLRDGRFSPTPDPDDLRDALRAALRDAAPAPAE
jgi:hypothetical protein